MNTQARDILSDLTARGVPVQALETDSRAVKRGDVFLAWPGARDDGRRHIGAAVAAGAAAVLYERDGYNWNADWKVPGVPVTKLRDQAGVLAHEVYGRPSEQLWTIGVTGTNGKTSCTQWLARACSECGARTAVVGTLGIGMPGALSASANTTPDPVLLHRSLAELHAAGAQGVAMEVSSIGLDQGRVNGIAFGAALFTNLSRDHLDYHGDMESYARAKQKLFETPGLKHAVVNLDDVQGVQIARMLGSGAGSGANRSGGINRVGYSTFEHVAQRAGLDGWMEAHGAQVSPLGIDFTVKSSWGEARIESRLLGRFNISNLLGVLATMLVSGVPFEAATAALGGLEPVPGRMQRFGGGTRPLVVVDFAHSPDALEKTLTALKDARAAGGRLVCVFGCGGDRDRGKRPLMGAVAARHADRIVLTSDNPRSEGPDDIIAQIMEGIPAGTLNNVGSVSAEPDRVRAIAAAVRDAAAGDVVLLAGKGHEDYQEILGDKFPFSDAEQAETALRGWEETQVRAHSNPGGRH
jgi:UDP-N-acetylmuramoyl-L-alanyl-D-glutamate--2,6-diaminopimelate ligase